MKHLYKTFTLLIITLLLITSCNNDDSSNSNEEINFTPPTEADFNALQGEAFQNLIQNASFNAEDGITFESAAGVILIIRENCLRINGDLVTGNVDLEYVEIFDRGNMCTTNATTTGEDLNHEFKPLISGGEFNVKLYQNGEELVHLPYNCDMELRVPADLTGGVIEGMGPWDGLMDSNNFLTWKPQNTEFWVDESIYNTFIQSFGWFNCDAFYNDPDPKTEILVSVPLGYDNSNSKVYLARNGENSSLGRLFGLFPVGLETYIIFLSEFEGSFIYAIQDITIENGQQVTFTIDEAALVSIEELTQIINDLP